MQRVLKKFKELFKLNSTLEVLQTENRYLQRINFLNYLVANSKEPGLSYQKYGKCDIIVSLTTHGKRIHDVYLTVESIMQQFRKPNRIILWLGNECEKNELPMSLQLQKNRGLEVRFCRDIRSYTKLVPTLREFPNDVIVTVDDDLIYDFDMLDKLVRAYIEEPNLIHFNRGHKMALEIDGNLKKYSDWEWYCTSTEVSPLNFPTGVGGILYPPGSFNDEVFNEEVFLDICPYADDVWFKAMALLNGTGARKCYTRNPIGEEYLDNTGVQDIALGKINNGQSQNDVQIRAVFQMYNLYRSLQ